MSSPNIEPFRFLEITQLMVKIQISEIFQVYCTVRKVLADFAVCYQCRSCKALCDEKFRQIEGIDKKKNLVTYIELSIKDIS